RGIHRALTMTPRQRRNRWEKLRDNVWGYTAHDWKNDFLRDLSNV
ncbi:MAG: trehalose-6-phosphate synthase, partial [SAR202 cluster bacterium]|nr:trehalose-6-phosphate synthase [SAR202 cluster bacterium]